MTGSVYGKWTEKMLAEGLAEGYRSIGITPHDNERCAEACKENKQTKKYEMKK